MQQYQQIMPQQAISPQKYTTDGLVNMDNYYAFTNYVAYPDIDFRVNTRNITKESYEEYYQGLFNVILDGIKSTLVTDKFIIVNFADIGQEENSCRLSAIDLMFNLIFWYILISTDQKIRPRHIVFDPTHYMTQSLIKNFMDDYGIEVNRKKYSSRVLNNILDDCIYRIKDCDIFSYYLMQTVNLKDDVDLMNASSEYYDLLHADFTGVPIEDINKVGMDLTFRGRDIIMNSKELLGGKEHHLANAFRSGESINIKQNKEFRTIIGTKPDGNKGVFAVPITTSFINGGLNEPIFYWIDSHAGRTAQILSKVNVGDSGNFARILALNNSNNFLNEDPTYACRSKNFQIVTITSPKFLALFHGRYARFKPNGVEFRITRNSKDLIGKTIYLRSPMTCSSASNGMGICYKCYGDLAYTNRIFNIGRIASDILSSRLTQRLLSAKHLLETVINKILWPDEFTNYFDFEYNTIKVSSSGDLLKGAFIEIDPESIESLSSFSAYSEDDEENPINYGSSDYNEFITSFNLILKNKTVVSIHTLPDSEGIGGFDRLYLTNELNGMIRRKSANIDGKIVIELSKLEDEYIFFVAIHNNELSKTMEEIMDLINKNAVTKSFNRNDILQKFLETVIKGDLYISSVHCELILSNQLRSTEDILKRPDWECPDVSYNLITLNEALINNPSIIITLMYQNIAKTLYAPLTFRKKGTSFIDIFFMTKPGQFLYGDSVVDNLNHKKEEIIRDKYGFTLLDDKKEEEEEFIDEEV